MESLQSIYFSNIFDTTNFSSVLADLIAIPQKSKLSLTTGTSSEFVDAPLILTDLNSVTHRGSRLVEEYSLFLRILRLQILRLCPGLCQGVAEKSTNFDSKVTSECSKSFMSLTSWFIPQLPTLALVPSTSGTVHLTLILYREFIISRNGGKSDTLVLLQHVLLMLLSDRVKSSNPRRPLQLTQASSHALLDCPYPFLQNAL